MIIAMQSAMPIHVDESSRSTLWAEALSLSQRQTLEILPLLAAVAELHHNLM